ncbi:hypothetical protein EFJ21_12555, partial [Staphylococcus haemolyticus]
KFKNPFQKLVTFVAPKVIILSVKGIGRWGNFMKIMKAQWGGPVSKKTFLEKKFTYSRVYYS